VLGQDKAELKFALINMKVPEEQKSAAEKSLETAQNNLKQYIDPLLKNNIFSTTSTKTTQQMADSPEYIGFVDCVDKFAVNPNIQKIQGTLKSCTNYVNSMKKTDWDRFVAAGIKTPENFKQSMLAQLESVKKEMEKYNKPDEVVIVKDYFTMDEVNEEDLAIIQKIDPNILGLSKNVQAVLVNMYSSPNLKTFIDDQVAEKDCADDEECTTEDNPRPIEGIEELIELTQILDIINNNKSQCWTNGQLVEIQTPASEIAPLKGKNEKKEESEFGRLLLGVESDKDMSKIDGYKYTDGDKTYYLYHGRKTQMSEDVWVMAQVSPDGEMSFKYFRIQDHLEQKVNIVGENNIKVANTPIQSSISSFGKNSRIYFQAQEGLIIQGSKESAPLIGNIILPKNKIIIAQINSVIVHPKVITSTNMAFTSNSVDFNMSQSTLNNKWAAGVGVRWTGNASVDMRSKYSGPNGTKANLFERIEVSPLKQSWQISGNIRMANLMISYSDNLKGNRGASINYVTGRNYVGLSTNLDDQFYLSMGRQFKNDRGGIIATTNFKDNADVKMIFFLTKKQQQIPPDL